MAVWMENDAEWFEERMIHCGTCGRMIAKRFLREEFTSGSVDFCGEECLDLYVNYAQTPLLVLAILLPVISLLVRFRRSRGVKRQQLKWFVSAGATRSCCRHVALRGGGAILGVHRKHFVGLPDPGRRHLSCIHGRSAPALPLVGHRSPHKPRAPLRYVDPVRLRRAWCPGTGVRPDHTAHAEHRLEFFGFEILV